jgi:RNA polymerase sigma factor (sigma-70 family)
MESRPFSAYVEIIGPIEDQMIRSIWRIVHNEQDAEDALQNALATLWRRWNRVARHANPQALALKICADAAYDALRRRSRAQRNVEPHPPSDCPVDGRRPPLDELEADDLRAEIQAALGQLSRQQAVAVVLRLCDELPYDQIAAAMGCTAATARKHVERARGNLRVVLARHEPKRTTRNSR